MLSKFIIKSSLTVIVLAIMGASVGWLATKKFLSEELSDLEDDIKGMKESLNFMVSQKTKFPSKSSVSTANRRLNNLKQTLSIDKKTDQKNILISSLKSVEFKDFENNVTSLGQFLEENGIQIKKISEPVSLLGALDIRRLEALGYFENIYKSLVQMEEIENLVIKSKKIELQEEDGFLTLIMEYSFAEPIRFD